jgi:hypothetical protein
VTLVARGHPPRSNDSIEQGLRDLAQRDGPGVKKIVGGWTPGLERLRDLSEGLARGGSADDHATALLDLIVEEIMRIESSGDRSHPRCAAALQAAFRLPTFPFGPDDNSIAKRLEVARRRGAFDVIRGRQRVAAGPESGKNNWNRAVVRLARALEQRLADIDRIGDWARVGPPSGYQPFTVDRLVVTHFLQDRVVTEWTTERWVTAEEDDVSTYVVRAYARNVPPHQPYLEVQPLLNCTRGTVRRVDLGDGSEAHLVDIHLARTLCRGEKTFFATRVVAREAGPTRSREVQVTAHSTSEIVLRVQFDPGGPRPHACWYFAEMPDTDRLLPPPRGDRRYLAVSAFGYVEHRFVRGRPTNKYGLAWSWADPFESGFEDGRRDAH